MDDEKPGLLERQVFRNQDRLEKTTERLVTLETKFDHAPKQSHLDRMETNIMAAVDVKIAHICDHLTAANLSQSKDLTTEWRNQRTADREAAASERQAELQAILGAIEQRRSRAFWWVMGIVAAVIGSVGTTLILVVIFGRPD